MLEMTGLGFGAVALGGLLASEGLLAAESSGDERAFDLRARPAHFSPRAKSIIMLMQNGGPSQVELFDPKPELNKRAGQVHRDKVEMFQPGSEGNKLLGCPFKFQPRGQCGMEISEVLPHLSGVADDLCLVRSMHTGHNNHTESLVMITSGKIFPGRPTLGSWISYALGSENQNLPSYIVLRDPEGYPGTGSTLWQNGWLPAIYRGTEFNAKGPPVLNLSPTAALPDGAQRDDLEFLARINQRHREGYPRETALEARIRNYELAARMQLAAGDALDLSKESDATRKMYGLDEPTTAGYGARCLMARRLVESGVRFVQVFPGAGNPWDSHGDVKGEIEKIAAKTDLPSAALIRDLKARGLLESTIVVWTGEFGRLPVSQNGKGRDHNRNGFSLLLAGGGFKAGYVHGATDDVGYRAVEKPVHVTDLFATLLHQLGLDHNKLTFRHHGRDETLTDSSVTGAKVVHELVDAPARA
ncbi:MAG: DUF1501 domain-containing protein [Planctomycetia bacterium]|nr:DUF1501 domain-containing protein [Planctomycetia bacterium]